MKVIIADSEDITRIGMRTVLESIPLPPGQTLSVYEADDRESLASSVGSMSPDVVVVEEAMVEDDLSSRLVGMVKQNPATHWVIFARHVSRLVLLFTQEHAAFSIIMKSSSREEIQGCLRLAMKKKQYICNECMKRLLGGDEKADAILTPAECTVLALLAQGLQVKDIADLQNRSRHTIKTHKRDIFFKLGVKSTLEAIMTAYKLKIINPPETQ